MQLLNAGRSGNLVRLRPLALLTSVALLTLSACGGVGPASSGGQPSGGQPSDVPATQTASTPVAPGSPAGTLMLVNLADVTDPGAAAEHELVLNHEVRADGDMEAVIGAYGEAVFQELDAQASAFSQESLKQVAHLVDTGEMPQGATSAASAHIVARVRSGLPSRQNDRLDDIDLNVFAETGFTTSALLGVAALGVGLADQTINGSVPRSDHSESISNGLRQVVDLNMTWFINSGGGKIMFEIQMSATDNISNATDGSFVALYTSTSDGKFDVNACPEEGGIARGTYSFQTKHEMNDVSGAANAPSGGGRAVDAPFTLYDGDDAHLLRLETTFDMAADAHGPGGGGSGSANAFDWTATQTLPIVMTPGGPTTSTGGSGLSGQGTGAERAAGSMFNSSAMAQIVLAQISKETESFWRSGKCIELTPSRDTGKVNANEQVDLSVTAAGKFQPAEIAQPISATFSGAQSLDPVGEPVPYPPTFTLIAGPNKGDKGTIDLQQVSNRGIGKKIVEFTVGSPPGFGGTIQYDLETHFLEATTTYHITLSTVLHVDDSTKALTADPDGASTFSYDFNTTGGNKDAGSDCSNCPVEPPCTSHGEGKLMDPAVFKQGQDGILAVTGALGDAVLHLVVAIPISCSTVKQTYFQVACGDPDGLKAELSGDLSYKIDSSCKADLSRPGYVNTADGHVEGALAPLDNPSPSP